MLKLLAVDTDISINPQQIVTVVNYGSSLKLRMSNGDEYDVKQPFATDILRKLSAVD